MERYFFLLVFFGITVVRTYGQSVSDSLFVNQAATAAKRTYSKAIGGDARLYNGVEYKYPVSDLDIGHPYFLSDVLEEGSINYDGQVFESTEMLYNLVTGVIVIEHSYSHMKIQLITKKINSFVLQGHSFVRLTDGPVQTDFYDMLYDGRIKLLAVRKKGAYPDVKGNKPIKMFVEEDQFFLYKNDHYFPVKNKSSLLRIMSDRKDEIRNHLQKNKINFKKNKEGAFIESVKFYDNLQKIQ